MVNSPLLNELLSNFLNEIPELIAALVIDLDGLIIAERSIKGFNEELIGVIVSVIEQNVSKIKRFTDTSLGSGTLDTSEFRLFYVELGKLTPALFVLVFDLYSNLDNVVPYSYIVAENVSKVLNNQEVSTHLPKLKDNGELTFTHENGSVTSKNNIIKILIIGNEKVGKSSLINMYLNGKFEKDYKPTIGISITKREFPITKEINLTLYMLELGGSKSFAKVRRFYYKDLKAVLILFDYSKVETLENIKEWIEEARHFIKEASVPYILIGNKIDLLENGDPIKTRAKNLADQYKFTYFETSALTGEGIDELFIYLASHFINI